MTEKPCSIEARPIEAQLPALADTEELVQYLCDVDGSKFIVDYLTEALADEGIAKWKVRLTLKLLTPLLATLGKGAGSLLTEAAKNRTISLLEKSRTARSIIDKLNGYISKTSRLSAAEQRLKDRLDQRLNRSEGDADHREALSLDLQTSLSQMDQLDELVQGFQAITELLQPQPVFKERITTRDDRDKFVYRSQFIPFSGRRAELEFLTGFLKTDPMFSWQLVLGPGGMGKSRLGLELCSRNGGAWRAGVLHRTDFDFSTWRPSQPTLLVIDYGFDDVERLVRILDDLAQRRASFDYKIRVLILERDSSSHMMETLTSNMDIRHYQHAEHLTLDDPGEDVVTDILEFFHDLEGTEQPADWSEDLAKLKEDIDEQMRPLYAAYFASARAKNTCLEDCTRTSLLEDVIKREKERFWTPKGVTEGDQALLALATIVRGISSSTPSESIPDCVTPMTEIIQHPERFKAIGGIVQQDDSGDGRPVQTIPPWEPDLVGELFVLEFLRDNKVTGAENTFRHPLLQASWKHAPMNTAAFLDRLRQDYGTHPVFPLLISPPDTPDPAAAHAWSMLAVNLVSALGEHGKLEQALDIFEDMKHLEQTKEIQLLRATAAFNLIFHMGKYGKLEQAEDILRDMKHLEQTDVTQLLRAEAAVNLVFDLAEQGKLEKAVDIFEAMEHLEQTEEIQLRRAKAAVNLVFDLAAQDKLEKAVDIFEAMEHLEQTEEIQLRRAEAAVNLVSILGEYGEFDQADDILLNMWHLEQTKEVQEESARTAFSLVINLLEHGMPEEAILIFQRMEHYEQTEEIQLFRARASLNLVSYFGKYDMLGQAWFFFRDMEHLEQTEGIQLVRAKAARDLVMILVKHGKLEQALDIFEAMEHLEQTEEVQLERVKAASNLILGATQWKDPQMLETSLMEYCRICARHPQHPEFQELMTRVAVFMAQIKSRLESEDQAEHHEIIRQALRLWEKHRPR